jgi:Ribbon-helix-helix protein, copG family
LYKREGMAHTTRLATYIDLCNSVDSMTPKRLYTFAIDPDLDAGLKALKARDGVNESETIRRALRQWLENKRIIRKTARPAQGKRTGSTG